MNRLQKKCFIAAAGFHLLLLVILFVGPAFVPSKSDNNLPVLTAIPLKTIDALLNGGGSPKAEPPPPAPPPQAPPTQAPPPPVPPQAVKSIEKEVRLPEPKTPDRSPVKPPTKVAVNTTPVARPANSTPRQPTQRELQEQQRAAAQRRAEQVDRILRGLKENLSSSTTIDVPGPGGEAYANYAQVVKSIYTQAWIVPQELADADDATAKVKVTISRDGTVISSDILQPSGNVMVDKSVQRTLQRVKFIAPFPEGAKEDQRTFNIRFNLKAKQSLG